ncbi:MAG: hypothetical protein ACTHQM_18950 [Thermoanaerobaculia bacterium]
MPFLLQTALLLGAGYALWRLWRLTDSISPLLRYLIAGGFLIRAFAGQALFWISYLELPFGRSLQLGRGLWFYGVDAVKYLSPASNAASHGLIAIANIAPSSPSVAFVKLISLSFYLFGTSTAVALLLNVAVFLAMTLLIVRWASRYDVSVRVTAIPLFAIGYLPTWILWSLQPLKDAFFCFLIVLFAFSVDRFVAAWKRPEGNRARHIAGAMCLTLVTAYLLAGVRWYYAALAIGSAGLVSLSVLFVRKPIREIALRAVVILAIGVISLQLFLMGGGPYIPASISARLQPWRQPAKLGRADMRTVGTVVEDSRRNLDSYKNAGTVIRTGHATGAPVAKPHIDTPYKEIQSVTTTATSAALIPQTTAPVARPAPPAASAISTKAITPKTPAPSTTPAAKAPAPASPKPAARVLPPGAPTRGEVKGFSEEAASGEDDLPRTTKDRLITGAAALLLPRWVAMKLELVSIGGGRGLMWFAELDTILFDLILLVVIAIVIGSLRRGAWRDPFVWYLVVVTVIIAAAIAYTISNYGTLLRHRAMLVATAVLLAIAVRRCRERGSDRDDAMLVS